MYFMFKMVEQVNQQLENIQRLAQKIEAVQSQVWDFEEEEKKAKDELELAKLSLLHTILRERGLGVCSETYPVHRGDVPNKLGIFPVDLMRYLYTTYAYEGGDIYSYTRRKTCIEWLCPQHFPASPNLVRVSAVHRNELDIKSELQQRDNRLFSVVNNIDVTDVPVVRYYSREVCEYFNIPPTRELYYYTTVSEPNTPREYSAK